MSNKTEIPGMAWSGAEGVTKRMQQIKRKLRTLTQKNNNVAHGLLHFCTLVPGSRSECCIYRHAWSRCRVRERRLGKTIASMVCNRRRKQKLAQHARPENHSGEASSHHRCQILERVEVAQVGGDHEFRKSTCTMQFIDVPTGGPAGN